MKNLKKLAAFALAGCLTLSSISVYAEDPAPAEDPKSADGTAVKTIDGSATIEDVDTESPIFTVTLPTATSYDFTIDTDGLLSMEEDQTTAKLDELINKGKIVFKNNEAFSYIKNQSSVPVIMQMDLKVTDDNTGKEVEIISTATKETNFDAKKNQMILGIVPCKSDVTKVITETFENTEFVSSEEIVPVSKVVDTATSFGFYLDSAAYVIKREGTSPNYTYKYEKDADTENNFDATAFQLAGKVNPDADWSAYIGDDKKEIGINIVYKFLDASQVDAIGTEEADTKYVVGADSLLSVIKETVPDDGESKLGGLDTGYVAAIKAPITLETLFVAKEPAVESIALSIPENTELSKTGLKVVLNTGSGDLGLKGADKANLKLVELENKETFYDLLEVEGTTVSIEGTTITINLPEAFVGYFTVDDENAIKVTYTTETDEEKLITGTFTVVE